jgi:2-(1,2-epoxy-1,2-dihydrophenyl)acetyl-CoA isomerase
MMTKGVTVSRAGPLADAIAANSDSIATAGKRGYAMSSHHSITTEAVDAVLVIRLNDTKALNAISLEMVEQLMEAFRLASHTKRAIMLTGCGRAFCSGINLRSMTIDFDGDYDGGVALESHINPLMMLIRDLPIPFVTAVNGLAAGIGSTIALAGDYIVAAEQAYFLQAFRQVGIAPDGGTAYVLTKAIGRVRAMEMMLLGERISAAKALEWGLINRVTANDDVETVALDIARSLASGPTKALGEIRKSCWHALEASFAEKLTKERDVQRELGKTADHREAVAAFMEKRPPIFSGS